MASNLTAVKDATCVVLNELICAVVKLANRLSESAFSLAVDIASKAVVLIVFKLATLKLGSWAVDSDKI